MTTNAGLWILERCASQRFPYRLTIEHAGRRLVLRVPDRWPGANRNVFCLRETEHSGDVLDEVERVPLALQRRGVRLSVVLDRPREKRCDFLFLKRPDRGGRVPTCEPVRGLPLASQVTIPQPVVRCGRDRRAVRLASPAPARLLQ